MELNEALARKVLDVVDAGLVKGIGKPIPGRMCVEAAVCYALGEPHGDWPSCVGSAVRAFKTRLNDAPWSSNEARTKGMRRVAIAQLGSNKVSQVGFAKEITFQVIRQIVPIALRATAELSPTRAGTREGCAVACEVASNLAEARIAVKKARNEARAADAAADAADASADAAVVAAAVAAADAATAAAYAAYTRRDQVLSLAAEIAVQALIKVRAKGCEWLWLVV